MKKFFGLLVCLMLISSCDDGELVLESFNFDAAAIQKCSDKTVLFKISGQELLLLDIPVENFPNEVTPADQPRIVTIGGANRLLYRKYNGNVGSESICAAVPPAAPVVTNEWTAAAGGKVQIITTEITTTDPVTNEVTVTGYNHQIKFLNVQFVSPNNIFVFEQYLFGTYTVTL